MIQELLERIQNYRMMRLAILVLACAVINSMALKLVTDWIVTPSPLPSYLPPFLALVLDVVLAFLVVMIPFFMSLVLSVITCDKEIVPPLYIQILTFAFFAYYAIAISLTKYLGFATLIGMYVIPIGLAEDAGVLYLHGRNAPRDQVARLTLSASSDIETVKGVLLNPRYRSRLGLSGRKPKVTSRGYELWRLSTLSIKGLVELERSPKPDETFINIALYFWDRFAYTVRLTSNVEESLRIAAAYIEDIMKRQKRPIVVTEDETLLEHAEFAVDIIVDTMQGLSTRLQELRRNRLVAVVATIGFWMATAVLAAESYYEASLGMLTIAVYVTYETRNLLKED